MHQIGASQLLHLSDLPGDIPRGGRGGAGGDPAEEAQAVSGCGLQPCDRELLEPDQGKDHRSAQHFQNLRGDSSEE